MSNANLADQYRQVLAFFDEYRDALRHLKTKTPLTPRAIAAAGSRPFRVTWQMDLLAGSQPKALRELYLEHATEVSKENEFFQIVVSEYPIETLVRMLIVRFPDASFEQLSKLHAINRDRLLQKIDAPKVLGAIFAVGAVLFRQFPKEVVSRYFDWDEYLTITFIVTLSVFAYAFLILLPWWLKIASAKRRARFVAEVLSYASLIQPGSGSCQQSGHASS